MPIFYDYDNYKGVKITVTPNNRLFKNHLKNYSRSIAVGETVDITVRLERLNDFDNEFWEKQKIISVLPERKNDYAAEIFWNEEPVLCKRINTIRTDCVGDVYFRISKVEFGIFNLNSKNSISLYYSKVESKDLIRREVVIIIVTGLIVSTLMLVIQYFIGVF
jgi:small-conductance mechanosensitive channel